MADSTKLTPMVILGKKFKANVAWDMFQSHLVDCVTAGIRRENTRIAVIPGGLISLVQPLDVSINKPFKGAMRVK